MVRRSERVTWAKEANMAMRHSWICDGPDCAHEATTEASSKPEGWILIKHNQYGRKDACSIGCALKIIKGSGRIVHTIEWS